ncbi:acyltransferase family protein [Dactylosporangium sp. CA-139114]|uniref:acyltransferase family protein n=1 Tax=Dactylosporangium sp. CA-139114 TaxID=3239931 RepID=UPI003D998166
MIDQRPAGTAQPRGRLAALDGLRLFAAAIVVAYHLIGLPNSHLYEHHNHDEFGKLYGFATYGYLGVQLFFMISGFVICMSSWGRSLQDFAVSRVVRLFPMYWVAVLISALVVHFNAPLARSSNFIVPVPKSDFLLNLTMVQNAYGVSDVDGVYWTLWSELRFYLLFALVIRGGLTYKRTLGFCLVWIVAGTLAAGANMPVLNLILQPSSMPYFVAGILLYLVHRFGPSLPLFGLLGVCFLLAQHHEYAAITARNHVFGTSNRWLIVTIVLTVFFALLSAVALGWASWARWRWLTFAGALTYPLYLLHQDTGIIVILSMKGRVAPWLALLATLTGVLLAAYLGHRFVEKPMAPWLKRHLKSGLERGLRAGPEPDPTPEPQPTPAPASALAPEPTQTAPPLTKLEPARGRVYMGASESYAGTPWSDRYADQDGGVARTL